SGESPIHTGGTATIFIFGLLCVVSRRGRGCNQPPVDCRSCAREPGEAYRWKSPETVLRDKLAPFASGSDAPHALGESRAVPGVITRRCVHQYRLRLTV